MLEKLQLEGNWVGKPQPVVETQDRGVAHMRLDALMGGGDVVAIDHPSPASVAISAADLRARSAADLSWPQAAMMSSPRGVRTGEA